MSAPARTRDSEATSHWYEDAVIYEVHVRAFADSDGDGIGDFRGLTQRLDYLEDLGVTVVWLLPFYPSPLRDDGYDIASYREVHPDYGTMRDFRAFLRAAHARGLRVITELVLNHTSDMHAWFQRARRARPGSRARDARGAEAPAAPHRPPVLEPDAARRSEPVAGGRRRLLRPGRRVPHGVPLPAHAADVHGRSDGGPLPAHRHPRPDPADPGRLP